MYYGDAYLHLHAAVYLSIHRLDGILVRMVSGVGYRVPLRKICRDLLFEDLQ